MNIKQLKTEVIQQGKKYSDLKELLRQEELKIELPKLKKRYEGKFFKCKNSSGSEQWNLYTHCRKVVDVNEFEIDQFELTPFDSRLVVNSNQFGKFSFKKQISKAEYLRALTKFKTQVNKLGAMI
jgi:hypothetical protein